MNSIDFLPAGYHQARERKVRARWHRAVFVVFALLVIAGTFGQWSAVSRERIRLEQLESSVKTAEAAIPPVGPLQQELDRLIEISRAVKVLEQDLSVITVIEEVNRLRPPGVSLTELHWRPAAADNGVARINGSSRLDRGAAIATYPPGQLLKSVLDDASRRQPVLEVTGLAPDHIAITDYLHELGSSPHFVAARLGVTTADSRQEIELQKFTLVLSVRPIGQPPVVSAKGAGDAETLATPAAREVPRSKPVSVDEHEIAREPDSRRTVERDALQRESRR